MRVDILLSKSTNKGAKPAIGLALMLTFKLSIFTFIVANVEVEHKFGEFIPVKTSRYYIHLKRSKKKTKK